MPKPRAGSVLARAVKAAASAYGRLRNRFGAGLELFNALRREFPNVPQSWLSRGYQLGKSIQQGVESVTSPAAGSRPFLKNIPIIPEMCINCPSNARILYRFRVRVFEKYGRTPKTFIVDVWSLRPLNADALQNEMYDRALATYARSPGARRGGQIKDTTEVAADLIFVGRAY